MGHPCASREMQRSSTWLSPTRWTYKCPPSVWGLQCRWSSCIRLCRAQCCSRNPSYPSINLGNTFKDCYVARSPPCVCRRCSVLFPSGHCWLLGLRQSSGRESGHICHKTFVVAHTCQLDGGHPHDWELSGTMRTASASKVVPLMFALWKLSYI